MFWSPSVTQLRCVLLGVDRVSQMMSNKLDANIVCRNVVITYVRYIHASRMRALRLEMVFCYILYLEGLQAHPAVFNYMQYLHTTTSQAQVKHSSLTRRWSKFPKGGIIISILNTYFQWRMITVWNTDPHQLNLSIVQCSISDTGPQMEGVLKVLSVHESVTTWQTNGRLPRRRHPLRSHLEASIFYILNTRNRRHSWQRQAQRLNSYI